MQAKIDQWYLALPAAVEMRLRNCAFFLGGLLLSRFEVWLEALRRGMNPRDAPRDAPPAADADADADCVEAFRAAQREGEGSAALPDFPEPPARFEVCVPLNPQHLFPRSLIFSSLS